MNDISDLASKGKTASAVRGAGWLGLGTIGEYGLMFINMAILARLVSPAEFGTVSLAISFLTITRLFSEMAMGPALIRRENVTPAHISVGFFTVMGLALLAAGLVVLASPWLASFFKTPQLRKMCWVIAMLIPLQASTSVSNALLGRKGAFRFLAISRAPGLILGYMCTSIGLALAGFGAWSILWGAVVQHSLTAAVTFYAAAYFPSFTWDRAAFKDLFSFSFGQTLAQIVNHFALVGDNFVVARALGVEALGFYGRAYRLMELPVNVVSTTSYKVAFPLLSSVQGSKERLSRAYQNSICALLTLLIPLSVFIILAARPIVLILLGPDWSGVILPFQILTVSLTFRAAYRHVNLPTLIRGGSYTIAILSALYAIWVVGGSIAAVALFGTTVAVATAVSLAIFVHYATSAWLANRALGIDWDDFAKLHIPGIAIAGAVGLSLLLAGDLPWIGQHVMTDLLTLSAAASIAMFACVIASPRFFLGQHNLSLLVRIAPSVPLVGGRLKTWTARQA